MAKEETKEKKRKFGIALCKPNEETGDMEPISAKEVFKKAAIIGGIIGGAVIGGVIYSTKRGGSGNYDGPIDVPYEEVDQ